jgi:hypothetical protein
VPFDWAVVPAIKGQVDEPAPAWLERLGEISALTLVVAGGPQSHVPQDQISEMARRIPDCQAVTIPAGHLVHDAMPGEFTETVMRFLRPAEVPGRSRSWAVSPMVQSQPLVVAVRAASSRLWALDVHRRGRFIERRAGRRLHVVAVGVRWCPAFR